jgi:hypothetical protein
VTTYVRAARAPEDRTARPRVTGRVLHLTTWAPDPIGTVLFRGHHPVPLCGGIGATVETWRQTGPEYDGWARHSHWPVCHRCVRTMDRLLDDLNAQDDRYNDHHRPPSRAVTELEVAAAFGLPSGMWVGADCRDGKHTACASTAWDEDRDELTGCACCIAGHDPLTLDTMETST